jgi:glycosyltransferase involved in cell wall biosynthesis
MRCLWLTLADPEPQLNGQYMYSGGLLGAFARAGAEVEVLGLQRPESGRRNGDYDDSIRWWLMEHGPQSAWYSLASTMPHIVHRCMTPAMRRQLEELLDPGRWDGIVFDNLSTGWALNPVLSRYPNRRSRPKLIYISHNHETSLRQQVAFNHPSFWKRQAMRLDAFKVARLERALVDSADLITAITPEDRDLYQSQQPGKRIDVITPGYHGRDVPERRITPEVPRRAIIVGSFDWVAKRLNLEEFVAAADPVFAAHGAELEVVGSADESFLKRLRRHARATRFVGTVDKLEKYMDGARVAIVPERSGGGFKLKVLDYVFNRLPILALNGSVAGVPLKHNNGILLFDSHEALARGVLGVMDDIELLNRLHNDAYAQCRAKFDWGCRGQQLYSAINAL